MVREVDGFECFNYQEMKTEREKKAMHRGSARFNTKIIFHQD